ncbi:TonB-dependent receptor [Danxiaibacter flavus]|uniref:TonB-dependent receptor n=1 Tax=Danxiaibacter flavus TaxID=3049108 RepID=A0ABV3ZLN3_9BACT|nr:TonB-dependent receptor [Chitinophagaceae bacterium DXS]
MKSRLLLMLLLCLPSMYLMAQTTTTINGKIIDKKNGAPVPGAMISLKSNPKKITTSNEAGQFTIDVPSQSETLLIHSIGYKDQEVPAGDGSALTVSLEPGDNGSLEEVVVVGVVMKKKDLTGAVSSINSDKIAQTPTTSINQAMQGKMPGARIVSNPTPGADASIKIRGNNSIQFGTNPIFVVDGTIIDGNFNTLNPDDIASVEVLKDASATAIYGSRGANGVVLVTTKKGKKGVGNISFNSWVGWQWFSKKMDLMNAHDLYNLRVDAYANKYMEENPNGDRQKYIDAITSDTGNVFAAYEQQTYKEGKSYDWLKPVTQSGVQQNYTLSFSGGSDKGTYLVSLNYTDQKGLIKTSDYKRFGGRVNVEQNVKSWLKIGTNTSFIRSTNDVPSGDVFNMAINANPLLPINDTMQYLKWADITDQGWYNPIKSLSLISNNNMNRLISSNYISLNPVKYLTIRSTLSADIMDQQNYSYVPIGTGQDTRGSNHGSATHYKAETYSWQWDNTASYSRYFGRSSVNAMVGASLQQKNSNYNQVNAYGFPSNDFTYMNLGAAYSRDKFSLGSGFVTNTLASYLGRVDYSFDNKYFATATLRYDGSSRFAPGNQWGAFPSLALGWDMSRENFMKDISWINRLKWRAGYGIAGNQNIPDYAFVSQYSPVYSNGQVTYNSDGRKGNPNLSWEKQKQLDIGLELVLLKNRLNITADYFNIVNKDLLMVQTLNTTSGFSNQVSNVGALKNTGVEVNVNYAVIQKKDLQWNVMVNFSSDKNRITKLYGQTQAIYNKGGFTGVEIQRTGNLFVGESLNNIYTYKFDKIAQEGDKDALNGYNFAGRMVHPGDIVPVDRNGDKVIDDKDRYVVGKLDPKFYGGFGTDLTYKAFSLNLFFNYSSGLKRISSFYESMLSSGGMLAVSHVDMLNRWTPTNTNTNIPRAMYGIARFNPGETDLAIQNASFIRLSTATLSYTLPKSAAGHMFLDNARIYVTGTNLLLFTKDKGFDPETGDGFPNNRSIVVGLNLNL